MRIDTVHILGLLIGNIRNMDPDCYRKADNALIQKDLYFTPEYGRLYEPIEGATLETFSFSAPEGDIYYQYLKRPVPYLVEGVQYYDAMTPYGYGGPVALRTVAGQESVLVEKFRKALDEKLRQDRIVCEFVRFHPMEENAAFFQSMYQLRNRRTAVYTDLSSEDPVAAEFDKRTQKIVRQYLKKGVSTVIERNPSEENLKFFTKCYFENMAAVGASEYFYFSESYFAQLRKDLGHRLILVRAYFEGELIGADLGFDDGHVYTCHLTGVTEKGRAMNAARIIVAEQARWAKANGFMYLFHGCGRTGAEDDSLLVFKKFFTQGCFRDYWQGSRVSDEDAYRKLCEASGKTDDGIYFPLYRKP